VIVPAGPGTSIEKTLAGLAGIDGLILSGGADVDSGRHGERALADMVRPDPARDATEFDLLSAAEDADAPIFAICRGLQVLNVARGGR
jgi:putative glutamine amidotransferase